MLYVFGFDEMALVAGSAFFVDPEPLPHQPGAEAGVRVELRALGRPPLRGSFYSAQPVAVDAPLARVDLFESFPGGRGSQDRVHYHPAFDGWEPSMRVFDDELSADPLGWLSRQLDDCSHLAPTARPADRGALAQRSGEVVATVAALWERVRSGVLDPPVGWETSAAFRAGWL